MSENLIKKVLQKGVSLYIREDYSSEVVDIDIDEDVHEMKFLSENSGSWFDIKEYDLRTIDKVFPQIDTIFIGENVSTVNIRNKTFPNVKNVVSENTYFPNGSILKKRGDSGNLKLLNTFCKKDGEEIDLSKVSFITPFAFDGCESANVTNLLNNGDNMTLHSDSFLGYIGANRLPRINNSPMLGHIMIDYGDRIPDCTTRINSGLHFGTQEVVTSKISVFRNVWGTYIPKYVYIDSKEPIELQDIYMLSQKENLKSIRINPDNPYLKSVDGIVYSADMKSLIRCPIGKTGSVVIPDDVEEICENAFSETKISYAVIPDSVTTVEQNVFKGSSITDCVIGKGMTYIGESMFKNCLRLKHIDIPSNIKVIKPEAFLGIQNLDIILHEGLECIDKKVFSFTPGKELELPASVKSLGYLSLTGVRRLSIKTRNDRLPKGLFFSITGISSNEESSKIMTLTVNGKEYLIPHYYIDAKKLDSYFRFYQFDEDVIWNIYKDIHNNEVMRRFMVIVYPTIESEEIKKEIKKNLKSFQKSIIKLLYKNNEEDLLCQFLSYGVCTKNTLESFFETTDEEKDVNIRAAVLNEMHKLENKVNKGFSL